MSSSHDDQQDQDSGTAIFLTPKNDGFPYEVVYTPLRSGATGEAPRENDALAIRLVRILPGTGDDEIKCTLSPANLSQDVPFYEALSYCAGSPTDCCTITLNAYPFNTFRSTYEALRRFRFPSEDRIFWIDQICINQTDIAERDNQVSIMSEIYRNAAKTQAWLGLAPQREPAAPLAFDFVREFERNGGSGMRGSILEYATVWKDVDEDGHMSSYTTAEALWVCDASCGERGKSGIGKFGKGVFKGNPSLHEVDRWLRRCAKGSEPERLLLALLEIFDMPWWTRGWIVQEVVLSEATDLVYGEDYISWERLSVCMATFGAILSNATEEDHPICSHWNRFAACREHFMSIRRQQWIPNGKSLIKSLEALRERSLGNPRDKIYAALGLLAQSGKVYGITPNYAPNNTVISVYSTAALAILRIDGNLHLLEFITGHEASLGLPTWAPDWRNSRELFGHKRFYHAGTHRQQSKPLLTDGRSVCIRGWYVDEVSAMGPIDQSEDATEIFEEWRTMLGQQKPNPGRTTDWSLLVEFVSTIGLQLRGARGLEELMEYLGDFDAKRPLRSTKNRRFFVSRRGAAGICLSYGREGNIVFVPFGSNMPLLIQKGAGSSEYHNLGPCYLYGIMNGEIEEMEKRGEVREADIFLV